MARIQGIVAALLAALIFVVPLSAAVAADASQAEIDQLRKEIDQLRKQLQGSSAAMPKSSVESVMTTKYGPNATATTKSGKLTIGGLLQVWFYGFRQDNSALFDGANGGAVFDTNAASDSDSFRIRRAELLFTMDIHENVKAVVRIDPAAEATSFPSFPDNQGNNGVNNLFKTAPNVSPEFDAANGPGLGSTQMVSAVQTGAGTVPRLLEDAYINYHGVVPHHDFQVGQFVPRVGEEGPRSNADLDFAERSMIGQLAYNYDMGVVMHGTWWDDRVQYWLGGFDSAGGFFYNNENRADTNSDKDGLASLMVRPVWKNETWGSLELGYSFEGGKHGSDAANRDTINDPINGVNIASNWAQHHAAWASYKPGGPVRGLWLRGEWQFVRDRALAGQVADLTGSGGTDYVGGTGVGGTAQSGGKPFSIQGFYTAMGYKLSDSCFADSAPSWLKPWEFAFRYEELQNVWVADPNNPVDTDVFKTRVYTAGINYYIKGNYAKIQANYNWVIDPHDSKVEDELGFHRVRNDSFVINFQVAF